ncbi:ATP-dependent DNA helicase [Vararia minispora EC-137]|uniref:ATP-dependent DNA helicase n=1 Tax=Vararia minispora EC-137 TaxID=1314806 RepID=A0ACB8QP27_9AGAM|nr:ATP-dependent DNA helicase [Vararia minispora EC-137]
MDRAHQILKDVFGFDRFRLEQEAVIRRLVEENENALVLFPTGGGKSLTFQIPALCFEGLTLVISPLIALMKDQVDVLCRRGVKAASLDSTLTPDRAAWVKEEAMSGRMKILYVAPERLNNESFIAMMSQIKISLLAVDESHCISQWGSSFRPEYLKIARFAEEMDVERVLCLTATATPSVAADICTQFYINEKAGIFRTPVYRPNLALEVAVAKDLDEKLDRIVPFLRSRTGPAIVYVTLQSQAVDVAAALHARDKDLYAMVYHAGLPSEEREKIQNKFMESEKGIVCATIAFGMGIDKGELVVVVHLYMPKTIENYSQEVGRAGRDGLQSTCLMFLSSPDIPVLEGFCRGDTCQKNSLSLWLQEVALKEPASDGTLDFNLYQQSKVADVYHVQMNVLNLCYAQLELDFGFIRAVTPYYSTYDISSRAANGFQEVLKSASPAARAIKKHWKTTSKGYTIDVVSTSTYEKVDRATIARQISDWELAGYIFSKPSQVRARYAIKTALPKASDEIQIVVDRLYEGMLKRENDAIDKLRGVIKFATDDDCTTKGLAQSLAAYFGDSDAVPEGMCGMCTFCKTGSGASFTTTALGIPDPTKIQAILNACHERDDPRLLARMAFGITSPRLTAGKWSISHPLFGSMVDTDFNTLVTSFDIECKKAGYVSTMAQQPVNAKKRAYIQTTSTSTSGSSSSRGRNNKRGRH